MMAILCLTIAVLALFLSMSWMCICLDRVAAALEKDCESCYEPDPEDGGPDGGEEIQPIRKAA